MVLLTDIFKYSISVASLLRILLRKALALAVVIGLCVIYKIIYAIYVCILWCLTHLSLVHSPGPSVIFVCIINSYSTLPNWPIVSLLILFKIFSMFFVLIHDYTPCFSGSPCCNFSYYNYMTLPYSYSIAYILCLVWPSNIHIPIPAKPLYNCDIIAVHFNHFPCIEISDKLLRYLL